MEKKMSKISKKHIVISLLVLTILSAVTITFIMPVAKKIYLNSKAKKTAISWCSEKYGTGVKVKNNDSFHLNLRGYLEPPLYYDITVNDGVQTYLVEVNLEKGTVRDTKQDHEIDLAMKTYLCSLFNMPEPDYYLMVESYSASQLRLDPDSDTQEVIYIASNYFDGNNIEDLFNELYPVYLFVYNNELDIDTILEDMEEGNDRHPYYNLGIVQISAPDVFEEICEQGGLINENQDLFQNLSQYAPYVDHLQWFSYRNTPQFYPPRFLSSELTELDIQGLGNVFVNRDSDGRIPQISALSDIGMDDTWEIDLPEGKIFSSYFKLNSHAYTRQGDSNLYIPADIWESWEKEYGTIEVFYFETEYRNKAYTSANSVIKRGDYYVVYMWGQYFAFASTNE